MKPKKYIICGFLTWSQNRWFMEIDMYAVADKKMLFIFSWTVILQLQGFITITLDKCVHDSTALLIHHTHFYTDFSCKHWFSNSTEPKLSWLTSNSSVLIDQFNCLVHLSSRNTSNVTVCSINWIILDLCLFRDISLCLDYFQHLIENWLIEF